MPSKTPYIQPYPTAPRPDEPVLDDHQGTEPAAFEAASPPSSVDVPVGVSLPSSTAQQLPTLIADSQAVTATGRAADRQSLIAEGVNFVGNAQLTGVCSVGGRVEGNLVQSAGHAITVIVTESGFVKGDIVASNISIMGQTDGLLDATGGSVTLHDASRVSGHVRYNRLQVNGADLNATLEKAPGTAATNGQNGDRRPEQGMEP